MGLGRRTPRRRAGALALAAAAGAAWSPVAEGKQDARVLLREGDVVGGATVERIRTHDVDVGGRWAAVVELEGLGMGALLEGAPVAVPGVPMANGDVPLGASWIDVEDGGRWLLRYATPAFPTGRIALDGQVVLSAGDPASGFGFAPGATITHLRTAVLEPPFLLVGAQVEEPGAGPFESALLFHLPPGSPPQPQSVLVRSGRPASAPGIVEDILATPAMGAAGDTLITYSFSGPSGTDLPAGDFNGAGAFVTGTPGPAPGTTWAAIAPRTALSRAPGYVTAGTLASPSALALGVVARFEPSVGPTVLALEGQALPARPAELVADFHSTDVDLADDGTALFAVPLSGGSTVLTDGAEVLLETGVSAAGGELLVELFHQSPLVLPGRPDTVHLSSDGRIATVLARLSGSVALLEIERWVGTTEPCAGPPNSTGARGRLGAAGSSVAGENRLSLRSTRLPPGAFAAPMVSRLPGFVPALGGGQGSLCLGGQVGVAGALAAPADPSGRVEHRLDLGALPRGSHAAAAAPGETWRFQVWHRDVGAGAATSNLTDVVAVAIR